MNLENIMHEVLNNKKQSLLYMIYIMAFFLFPFVICAFVVSGASNAGFNVVLTAILNICFVGEAYYIVNNSKTPIAIGFLLGSAIMMTLLNLMTSVYWGQLSHCQVTDVEVAQYSCDNPSAYGGTSTFAMFLFLTQLVFAVAVYYWRGELISETGIYDEISQHTGDAAPYESIYNPTKQSNAPPSTDL